MVSKSKYSDDDRYIVTQTRFDDELRAAVVTTYTIDAMWKRQAGAEAKRFTRVEAGCFIDRLKAKDEAAIFRRIKVQPNG